MDEDQFEQRAKLMQSQLQNLVRKKVDEFDDNHWCWLTFQSYQFAYIRCDEFGIKIYNVIIIMKLNCIIHCYWN